ncbi:MAG: UMP kinase [Clostridiales bacterium GWE2_32_10]|nr:MAG: UMP kinase [Clostridiales bacterium GWE2_32_10]HBY20237.1 UMP kinase [Clostridiales bacterium]
MYKRILIKLSGEALVGDKRFGFDERPATLVAEEIREIVSKGIEVALVVGAGNIWRGRDNRNMDMTKSHHIGILSTVINAIYMGDILRMNGVETIVQTPFVVGSMTEQFVKEKAIDYMKKGKVVIFAGGTGHPFFSTDTGAALRAIEIEADILLLAKSIDAVYDADPKQNIGAKKYDEITCQDIIKKGLRVVDLTATSLCLENGMNMRLFALSEERSILKILNGERLGTIIMAE